VTTAVPSTTEQSPLSLEETVRQHILRVLAAHDGNISAAARALGMHRRTLQRTLQRQARASPTGAQLR
jgi:two-component system, response regulator RegA